MVYCCPTLCRGSLSLGKFSLHLLSSVMLTNSQATQDLWISEMSGTFLCALPIRTTHAHHLLPLPWCTVHSQTDPTVPVYACRSQVQDEINNSWVSVNMQRLPGVGSVDNVCMICWRVVCVVCSSVKDKDWGREGGWITKLLNWGIMALKHWWNYPGQSLWSIHKWVGKK